MNFYGLLIGAATFLCIGAFHPLVIKAEYYLGVSCWWIFLLCGISSVVLSLIVTSTIPSIILGVIGFSCFWSILELFKQCERVAKGWFPANPNRKQNKK
ncbi:MAG: DUF4491 family protein [Bacteroidales bacterium]|nr:DUF4491 family protein [Bacteroidales bacterium]